MYVEPNVEINNVDLTDEQVNTLRTAVEHFQQSKTFEEGYDHDEQLDTLLELLRRE